MREVETQPRVRVAVVGLGKMGTLHLSLLSHMHDVEIVALVDTNKALFRTVQSMGVTGRFYATLEQALAAETVEAVYLITPTFTHVPLIKQALAAGVHVFVEKPVALHAGEITELARLRTDRIIQVGYTMLYVPVIREVRRILDTGSLGPIISVQASFAHGEVFGPKKGWMFNPALSGGGVLMNPGPHLFSIIAYLFGEPTRITGAIRELYTPGLDDVVEAHFSYPHYTLSAKLSWSVPDKPIGETQLTIRTRRGWIKTNGHEIRLSRDGKRQTIREEALLPDTVFELNPAAYGSAYFAESRAFIEAVQGAKRPVPNTLSKALAIETMIHQLYAARGQRA
jgi:predicted dehydrogenase